jgi:hypothetical protein
MICTAAMVEVLPLCPSMLFTLKPERKRRRLSIHPRTDGEARLFRTPEMVRFLSAVPEAAFKGLNIIPFVNAAFRVPNAKHSSSST